MSEAAIPVDLFNPGQVFASLGFLEAADVLLGDAEGAFDWSDEKDVRFRLRVPRADNPFAVVLTFLAKASVSSAAPLRSTLATEKWNVPTMVLGDGAPFPFPEPRSPATLPAVLEVANAPTIVIDHWGEVSRRTGRDAVKFWAGAGGYPGSALALDALNLARDRMEHAVDDPFSLSEAQSSSFRFDWRRDYIPIDVGFSPNEHEDLTMVGFPLVEILAAIGLGNARPKCFDKLDYRYGIIGVLEDRELYDPIFLRAALGGAKLPFPQRVFRMRLGWPGQENQARCITEVIEENRL
jgi:CRISPR-associated protein Csb3